MREIKFRAWDTEKQQMIEHNSQELVLIPCIDNYGADRHSKHKDWGDEDISYFDWASADLMCGRYKLMQFTGLKDKKGKDIYEGDIVKHPTTEKYSDEYYIVKYRPGCFVQQRIHVDMEPDDPYEQIDWEWDRVEIIGNIHQSPYLLEEN